MKKNNTYLEITEIPRKFYFGKSYFKFPFEGVLNSKVAVNKEYKEGVELTKPAQDFDVLTLHYKGLLKVVEGDEIKEGNTLSVSGSIRKKYLAAPVSGKIIKIDEEKKTLDLKYKIVKDQAALFKPALMPFEGKIADKLDHHIIIEFESFSINLFNVKGSDAIGELQYVDSERFNNDETSLDELNLKDKIVFTEKLTTEEAARLSAMGVKGILVYTLNYNTFSSIMTLSMPIGIVGGYDDLNLDKHLKTTLSKLENTKVIVDTLYKKAHILTNTPPNWLVD